MTNRCAEAPTCGGKPKSLFLTLWMLAVAVLPSQAQDWTRQDSLRLQEMLQGKEEMKLNREALKELEDLFMGTPKASVDKPWMEFDQTLPAPSRLPSKVKLTLYPYTIHTPYNWNPIRQRKIDIDAPRRNAPTLTVYSNWAKTPFDPGPRETVEQIEATGLRYRVTERANNLPVGSWQRTNAPTGLDLMEIFTKEFWNKKAKKRRERTLEVLKDYDLTLPALPPPQE